MAILAAGKTDALRHHSIAAEYTSEQVPEADGPITARLSMRRSGNVWGTRRRWRVFSSLKIERTDRRIYRRETDDKADVFDYIGTAFTIRNAGTRRSALSTMESEADWIRLSGCQPNRCSSNPPPSPTPKRGVGGGGGGGGVNESTFI